MLDGGEPEAIEGAPEREVVVPYEVVIEKAGEGDLDAELRTALRNASAAAGNTARPPASLFLLRSRARNDVGNLEAALRSLGYYDGTVEFRIVEPAVRTDAPLGPAEEAPAEEAPAEEAPAEGAPDQEVRANGEPAQLVFEVMPGERYTLGEIRLGVGGDPQGYERPPLEELGLVSGEPAVAQVILDAEQEVLRRARANGRPLAQTADRTIVRDRERRVLDVTLRIVPGPVAEIGEITFEEGEGVSDRLLRRRVPIRSGDRYDPAKLEAGRQSLLETGLFSSVRLAVPDELDEEGRLPVTYSLIQRAHRTIGIGAGFRTDEGPFANVFWENRNTFDAGELLRFDLYGSPLRQELSGTFRKPDFGGRRQTLLGDASIRQEDTDAFESQSIGAGVGFEKEFDNEWVTSVGLAYRFASIDAQDEEEDEFGLLSVPAALAIDESDDLLDPSTGWRLNAQTAPFFDTLGSADPFWKTSLSHTRYVRLIEEPRLVFAVRGAFGSITADGAEDIPADERFFAGGGGSVRGIPFQFASPLNDDDDPVGGLSLLELNTEIRFNVTESIGVVTFVDAGSAFEDSWPDFGEELRIGTGAGLRYATPIGPIRLDVAVPVDEEDTDDAFQLYISIGQAF